MDVRVSLSHWARRAAQHFLTRLLRHDQQHSNSQSPVTAQETERQEGKQEVGFVNQELYGRLQSSCKDRAAP